MQRFIVKKNATFEFWSGSIFLGLLILACWPVHAQPLDTQDSQSPIYEGYVIYEGQYLAPPYEFVWLEGLLTLNDLPIQLPRPGQFSRRSGEQSGRGQRFRMPPNRARAWLTRRLTQNSVLFCWADRPAVFLSYDKGMEVLQVLMSDVSLKDKLSLMGQDNLSGVKPDQRKALVQHFEVSDALLSRLNPVTQRADTASESDEAEAWYSGQFISAMTLSGFFLAVLALGTLVRTRPSTTLQPDPGAPAETIKLIGLVVALNVYDLICTVYAHSIGGLWELNPFAGSMMDETVMVIVFKLGLTVGAALLFYVARHVRIAQLGIYWIGVLYTVLILRWITYNAMFI
ncbi:MAG: hypothetical protein GY809_21475 [Planctomycetes bacterium]|nr:hypothetical protein [Planctomycetota bacterium]